MAGFDTLLAAYGSEAAMNHQVHISRAARFVYFNNPKVACSSTKATLNTAVAARSGLAFELTSMEMVHDRSANPLETPAQLGRDEVERMLADPGVLRFTFTRDPVARFCSAY